MIYKVWEEERGGNEAMFGRTKIIQNMAQASTGSEEDAHLPRKFDAMLDSWIRFQGLSLDFVKQIWPPAQKLVMRELPSLCI